jgi:flavin-dependent dehydrogenase
LATSTAQSTHRRRAAVRNYCVLGLARGVLRHATSTVSKRRAAAQRGRAAAGAVAPSAVGNPRGLPYNAGVREGYEVIIAGAGPGGTATAMRLLQRAPRLAGRVLVLDRASFPRDKPCGGGLTGRAADAMAELGLSLTVDHTAAADARVRFGGFERSVVLGRPVRIVRREDFDAALVVAARQRGADVVEGEGVAGYAVDGRGVTVTTGRGRSLRARVLVGADGAASVVRKQLLERRRAVPHRLFKLEMTVPATREPTMIYDFTPMIRGLRGYLWVFPVPGGRVNVGLMHYPSGHRLGGSELTLLLRDGLLDHGIELPARGARGWPAWGYHPDAPVAASRVVTVGDAAGIDGLTGEGIAVAMEHALVAGDSIAEAFDTGDFEFAQYRRRLRRAVVGRELALDRWLARLLYGGRARWRSWLSLVLYDREVLELYAARVSGTAVLADHKLRLYRALARHVLRLPSRRRALAAAERRPRLLAAQAASCG